jgi:hypothetical protein
LQKIDILSVRKNIKFFKFLYESLLKMIFFGNMYGLCHVLLNEFNEWYVNIYYSHFQGYPTFTCCMMDDNLLQLCKSNKLHILVLNFMIHGMTLLIIVYYIFLFQMLVNLCFSMFQIQHYANRIDIVRVKFGIFSRNRS